MLALCYDAELGEADLVLDDAGALADGNDLETAVLVSLLSDARVSAEEAPGEDRRGWWGDAFSPTPGDRLGSRLWAIQARGRARERDAAEMAQAAEEALAWLLEEGVAGEVTVSGRVASTGRIELEVRVDDLTLTL